MMQKVQGLIFAVCCLGSHYYFIFPLRYVISIAPGNFLFYRLYLVEENVLVLWGKCIFSLFGVLGGARGWLQGDLVGADIFQV